MVHYSDDHRFENKKGPPLKIKVYPFKMKHAGTFTALDLEDIKIIYSCKGGINNIIFIM